MPADPITSLIQGGAVAALVFVVYGFLWGPVFSARTVTMIVALKDAQLADKDKQLVEAQQARGEWQARVDKLEERTLAMSEQLGRAASALEMLEQQNEDLRRGENPPSSQTPRQPFRPGR